MGGLTHQARRMTSEKRVVSPSDQRAIDQMALALPAGRGPYPKIEKARVLNTMAPTEGGKRIFPEELPKRGRAMDVVRREEAIGAQVGIRRLEFPGHVIPGVQAVVVKHVDRAQPVQ